MRLRRDLDEEGQASAMVYLNPPIGEIAILAMVFMTMTAAWCATAYYLVNHPLVATRIRSVGRKVLPLVSIGLGIFILARSFVF
jgi:cadmium resistance protein CadD (predicted permease)